MNKSLFIIALFSILFLKVNGQELNKKLINIERTVTSQQVSQVDNQVIWESDFSDKSVWSITNDAGNSQNWKITTYPPQGNYSGQMGIINSTTASNKYAIFDSDLLGNGTSDQKGNLTTANPIDCSDYTNVVLEFQSYYAPLDSKISVKVSNNDGETWQEYFIDPDLLDWYLSKNPEIVRLDISEVAANQKNILIRFYFDGLDSDKGLAWMIDDVVMYQPTGLEAVINSIDNYWIMGITDPFEMKATIQNFGIETINSVTLSYSLNDYTSDVTTIDNLDIKSFETATLTYPEKYNFPSTGNYTPGIEIIEINGREYNLTATGDYIEVYDSNNKKAIMSEVFTSSSCSPCGPFAQFYDKIDDIISPTLFSTIKYPVNWPGTGDPYYTSDVQTRLEYYDATSAPSLYLNGGLTATDEFGLDIIRTYLEQAATANLNIQAAINEKTVSVTATVEALEALSNSQLYVVINEKLTHDNATTNGENDFRHVMLKMLPNGNGTSIAQINKGDSQIFNFSYDMTHTHMEEINDLEVVVFLQSNSTQEILQSKQLDLSYNTVNRILTNKEENNLKIVPNPVNNSFRIVGAKDVSVFIYDISGKLMKIINNYSDSQQLDISEFKPGIYLIRYNGEEMSTAIKLIKL